MIRPAEDEVQQHTESPEDEIPVVHVPTDERETTAGRIARIVFILLTVGMVGAGLWWNHVRIRDQVQKANSKGNGEGAKPVELNPNDLDPPPAEVYGWLEHYDPAGSIAGRIPTPNGFQRAPIRKGSIQHYLRYLPTKAGDQPVRLHTGQPRRHQVAQYAVIDIDTGSDNAQRAAQSVVRLWAEYLLATGHGDQLKLCLDDGSIASWSLWRARKQVDGVRQDDHELLGQFLAEIYPRISTETLAAQFDLLDSPAEAEIGDVLINPGRPGHAAIVVDMAFQPQKGHIVFLLAQGGEPAQDLHVLVNPVDANLSPWYPLIRTESLRTPEYTFPKFQFYRFRPAE